MTDEVLEQSEAVSAADRKILVLGHSHTNALSMALAETPDPSFQVINVNTLDEQSDLTRQGLLRLSKPTHLVSMVGGNTYYQVALLEHPQRLQVLSGPEDTDLDPERHLVTYQMMRDFLANACRGHFQLIARMQEVYELPLTHVISPPPLAAADLSDILPPAYRKNGSAGTVPPLLRLKIYQMKSEIIREFCASRSFGVIGPPAEACDEQGFLRDAYRSFTATHAGKEYGHLVMKQIAEMVNG